MPTVRPRTTQYLWEFLLELLDGKEACPAISWINRERGEFVLNDQSVLAKLWGKVKGRPRMDKIKLGRAMRYYYKNKVLAKVPKRKAVYRFVKFDYLKQNVPETMDEIHEIDFSEVNTLDLIKDTETCDTTSLSSFNEDDSNDIPLENLLINKCDTVLEDQTFQNLFPMGTNRFQNDEFYSTNLCNKYIDNSSNRGYGLTDIKSEDFKTINHLNSFPVYGNIENTNIQSTNSNSYFTSLLVKSILISDDLEIQEPTDFKEEISQQQACRIPAQNVSPTFLPMFNNSVKHEPVNQSATYQIDTDLDSTFNALKEFERMAMLNSLVHL